MYLALAVYIPSKVCEQQCEVFQAGAGGGLMTPNDLSEAA
jgi:hypothetical protein